MLKGFTREQIAEKLNLSLTAYANIERGETDLSFSRFEDIAKILDVPPLFLFGLGENMLVYGNNYNTGSVGNSMIGIGNQDADLVLQIEKQKGEILSLKAENEGLKKELTHLGKIITLLEKS